MLELSSGINIAGNGAFGEARSPISKGKQARPNMGDDDIFSPGNKDSSNNSLSSYEWVNHCKGNT